MLKLNGDAVCDGGDANGCVRRGCHDRFLGVDMVVSTNNGPPRPPKFFMGKPKQ